jgi:hypothetical protein
MALALNPAKGSMPSPYVADDEARPKELYTRLGFRPAWASMEFERHPL